MNDQKTNHALTESRLNVGLGCIFCIHAHSLPDFDWCRACGFGLKKPELVNADLSQLAKAVKAARGGDAPTPFKGYA